MIAAARVSWVIWAVIGIMLVLQREQWIAVATGVMVLLALVGLAPFLWTGKS